jgi:hypothetical protein
MCGAVKPQTAKNATLWDIQIENVATRPDSVDVLASCDREVFCVANFPVARVVLHRNSDELVYERIGRN